MSAGGMMGERRRRGHPLDGRAHASATDARGHVEAWPTTVTLHVPLALHQRRGRRVLVASDGADQERRLSPRSPGGDSNGRQPAIAGERRASVLAEYEITPTVRALARAFRWRRLLETGAVATVHEIAVAESINPSYVSRVLRLTLLAPEIIEAVMEGRAVRGAETLDGLMLPFPIDWGRQALLGY